MTDLGRGITADIRGAIGEDDKYIYAIRDKIESLLKDRGTDPQEYANQYRFAVCVRCTKNVKGLKFKFPKDTDDAQTLADAYRKWMKLPLDVWSAWHREPYSDTAVFNADDLLPPDMVPEAIRNGPLQESAVKTSA